MDFNEVEYGARGSRYAGAVANGGVRVVWSGEPDIAGMEGVLGLTERKPGMIKLSIAAESVCARRRRYEVEDSSDEVGSPPRAYTELFPKRASADLLSFVRDSSIVERQHPSWVLLHALLVILMC